MPTGKPDRNSGVAEFNGQFESPVGLPDPMAYLEGLTKIGPRPTCGEAEKKAASYAQESLRQLGFNPQEERFRCNPSMFRGYIFVFLFVVAMGALPPFLPFFGVGFFLAASGCFFARKIYTDIIHNKKTLIHRFFPQKPCRNIIAKLNAKGERKNRIIFLSHLDTALCSPIFSEKMVRSLKTNIKLDRILFVVLGALYLAAFLTGNQIFYYGAVLASLYVLGSLLVLLYSEMFSPTSPGVNDNASGVAGVLTLADYFSKNPLTHSEIWFVCLGAEESGTYGSKDLYAQHASELRDSYIINIDSVASGHPRFLVNEGYTEEYTCDPEMIAILENLRKSRPELHLEAMEFKGWGGYTDCTHLLQNGCRATTLVSTDAEGFIKNWHTLRDTMDGIEKDTFQHVLEIAVHLAKNLDQKFANS